jgi:hypothetical protein
VQAGFRAVVEAARRLSPDLEISFKHTDVRVPEFYNVLPPVDTSLVNTLLHHESYTSRRTSRFICVAQPCLRESTSGAPASAALLQFWDESTKDFHCEGAMWRREVPCETFDGAHWIWGWDVNVCAGMHGLLGFLRELLLVYRVHREGAWNKLSAEERIDVQLALISEYDRVTMGVYREEFAALRRRLTRANVVGSARRLGVGRCLTRAHAIAASVCPQAVVWLARMVLPPVLTRLLRRATGREHA